MKPRMEKITKPAKTLVRQLAKETMSASLERAKQLEPKDEGEGVGWKVLWMVGRGEGGVGWKGLGMVGRGGGGGGWGCVEGERVGLVGKGCASPDHVVSPRIVTGES